MTTRITLLIGSAILAGGALGGFIFLLSAINGSVTAIAVAQGDAASAEKRATLLEGAQEFLAGTVEERAELDAFVAGGRDIVAAIEIIEAEAEREGVSLTVSSVNEVPTEGWKRHQSVRLELSAAGTFGNLAAFVSVLEQLPFASRLESADFGAATERSWFGKFVVLVVAGNSL